MMIAEYFLICVSHKQGDAYADLQVLQSPRDV